MANSEHVDFSTTERILVTTTWEIYGNDVEIDEHIARLNELKKEGWKRISLHDAFVSQERLENDIEYAARMRELKWRENQVANAREERRLMFESLRKEFDPAFCSATQEA